MFDSAQIEAIKGITQRAGQMLEEFFQDSKYRQAETKADGSPVTLADKTVSEFLIKELGQFGFPVVSEEGAWMEDLDEPYFLVDPLDGTKYFSRGEKDFAVLVGFVKEQKPVFGCIHSPTENHLYHAIKGEGGLLNGKPITNTGPSGSIVAFSSGFHKKPGHKTIEKVIGIEKILFRGSVLKFCDLAIGKAHFFPRFGPTSEWDTAGAQVLLEECDCSIINIRDSQPLTYGKSDRLNRGFIAFHNSLRAKVDELIENYVRPQLGDIDERLYDNTRKS